VGLEAGRLLGGDAEEGLVVELAAGQDGQPARRPRPHGDVLLAVLVRLAGSKIAPGPTSTAGRRSISMMSRPSRSR
jgi:hypothetical protein